MKGRRKLFGLDVGSTQIDASELAFRAPLYHPDFPAVLLWSQKSACTIVVKWFLHHIGRLQEALDFHPWIHNFENNVYKARPGYLKECAEAIRNGKPVVKFVRNPYERAFSGYLETCNRRVLVDQDHWSTRARLEVLNFFGAGTDQIEYAYSFAQFCEWLGTKLPRELDPHLAPQYEAFEEKIDAQIVRIDEANDHFAALEKQFGLIGSSDTKGLLRSSHHHRKAPTHEDVAKRMVHLAIPVRKERSFIFFDASASAIRQTAAANSLQTLYRSDFDAYRYNF